MESREIKNKDEITIEAEQVWLGGDGHDRRVVGFTGDGLIITENLKDHSVCTGEVGSWRFATLVSDPNKPWLPLPDGYRLPTEEEGEYRVPKDYMVLDVYSSAKNPMEGSDWRESDGSFHSFKSVISDVCGFLIAIPIDHVWEEDKPKVEYKVFEINMWGGAPYLEDGTYAQIGCRTDCGYTLFGYTDLADWPEKVNHDHPEGKVPHYYTEVSDHKCDRKYAIGRKDVK